MGVTNGITFTIPKIGRDYRNSSMQANSRILYCSNKIDEESSPTGLRSILHMHSHHIALPLEEYRIIRSYLVKNLIYRKFLTKYDYYYHKSRPLE